MSDLPGLVQAMNEVQIVAMKQGRLQAHRELLACLKRHIDEIPLSVYLALLALTKEAE